MSIAFFNGQYLPLEEVKISPLDRGFLFADGVYEVIPVYAGEALGLDEHLQRLQRSLGEIRLDSGFTVQQWRGVVNELVDQNGGGNLSVYLQITRGVADRRDHNFSPSLQATLFGMVQPMSSPLERDVTRTEPVSAITCKDIRWHRCDIKSISLLPNILLKQQARQAGAEEAILLRDGMVTEASAANVFVVRDGLLLTPPENDYILGGITRKLTLQLARENGLPCEEAEISESELRDADEIWICSSTRELVPVIELDDRAVGDGKIGMIWRKMAELYQKYKLETYGNK